MGRAFSIISAGPGYAGMLTARARQAIEQADEVYACGRVAGALASLRGDWKLCPEKDLAELAESATGEKVAVVMAGDAGFFGGVQEMAERLRARGAVCVHPGISSVQYFCAKIGESYDDVFWAEEGSCDLLAAVSYRHKVCLVLDGGRTVDALCAALCEGGLGDLRIVVGSRLGTGREQILHSTAQALCTKTFPAPAIMLLFNAAASDPLRPVFDAELTSGEGARVGQEVRWNAVNLLCIRPHDTVYDLGAGNGAVSMEMARRARSGCVFAVEEHADAMHLVARNREALGCFNVRLVQGESAAAIGVLPAPDAAFVGVGAGSLREILGALKEKNPHVRVVVAADSLERLSEAQLALSTLRFKHVAVSQLLLSRARTLGSYTMMLAGETMFLLSAGKA